MKNILAMWKCRNLSLKGKVTVINTLAISPLLYLANTIHVPPQVITEVKQIVVDFIWDGKPSKIAYNVLVQSIEDGGLKLVDFESKVKAAKIVFVKRLLDKSKARWKASAPTFLNTNNTHLYFQCNQSKTEKIKSKFYADVHNFWSEIQAIEQPTSAVIKNQVIWENRYITIQNKPFRWQKWLQHGIRHVRDILSDEGDFLSHEEINHRYGVQCNFLNVLQIRHSIPFEWRQILRQNPPNRTILEHFVPCNDSISPLCVCYTKTYMLGL